MKERENSRVSIGNDDEQDLRIDLPLLVSADSCRLQEREKIGDSIRVVDGRSFVEDGHPWEGRGEGEEEESQGGSNASSLRDPITTHLFLGKLSRKRLPSSRY